MKHLTKKAPPFLALVGLFGFFVLAMSSLSPRHPGHECSVDCLFHQASH